jgi:CheY-like chemotaxis protein
MVSRKRETQSPTLLLAEADDIVRFVLAERLRACGYAVIEAVDGAEAKAVLVAGPKLSILFSDPQLAGESDGFALAQWVRRHRKSVEVILSATLAAKAQAVCDLCTRRDAGSHDAAALASRIQAMLAERKRRTRPSTAPAFSPKRKRH